MIDRADGAETDDVDTADDRLISQLSIGAGDATNIEGRSVTCLRHERRSAGSPAGPGALASQDAQDRRGPREHGPRPRRRIAGRMPLSASHGHLDPGARLRAVSESPQIGLSSP